MAHGAGSRHAYGYVVAIAYNLVGMGRWAPWACATRVARGRATRTEADGAHNGYRLDHFGITPLL
jgi:hypothetical protein